MERPEKRNGRLATTVRFGRGALPGVPARRVPDCLCLHLLQECCQKVQNALNRYIPTIYTIVKFFRVTPTCEKVIEQRTIFSRSERVLHR
jgi:hypothetical protein